MLEYGVPPICQGAAKSNRRMWFDRVTDTIADHFCWRDLSDWKPLQESLGFAAFRRAAD